jgi:hypothetical protein
MKQTLVLDKISALSLDTKLYLQLEPGLHRFYISDFENKFFYSGRIKYRYQVSGGQKGKQFAAVKIVK